jgi:phage shock protein B
MGSIMVPIAIAFVTAVPLIIIAGTILLAIRIIRGGATSRDPKAQADETRVIQEIYQGLSRMEERVEALETILIEREKGGKEK